MPRRRVTKGDIIINIIGVAMLTWGFIRFLFLPNYGIQVTFAILWIIQVYMLGRAIYCYIKKLEEGLDH